MTSTERVTAAIDFRTPDRLPRWDNFHVFGAFASRWREWKGFGDGADPTDHYGIDIAMISAEEGPFRSRLGVIGSDGDYEIYRDEWGRVIRQQPGHAYFMETIETLLDDPANLDSLEFEDPRDDARYTTYCQDVERQRGTGRLVFTKVGGLYCRTQFMRREDRLLMDMMTDEGFCHALFGRVADYLTVVALEQLTRTDSWDTGIWVYDDCANNLAPMFSPAMWEKYLLPLYSRFISTLRSRGCKHFFLHSDGNIGPLLDLMIEAGFEGFNPLEPRCGLDLIKLREKYGRKVVFFGGICNTLVLPKGDKKEIEAHVRPLIELGRDGGLIIGQASIGDDISPEAYDYYISLLDKHANYR